MKNFEQVLIREEGATVVVTINRPEALNALNATVLQSLESVIEWIERDAQNPQATHPRVMILTGAGEKAFVAGADIKQFEEMSPQDAERFAVKGQTLFTRLEKLPIPVIAAVNGFALGGGLELAMACDFIYASENAKFGLPECTLGIMPGFGGTVRLPRRVGVTRAREMAFSGAMLSAQEAASVGLVNKVLPQAELMDAAIATAKAIAQKAAPKAVTAIKRSIFEGTEMTSGEASGLEALLFGELFASEDKKEGVSAFLGKRKPEFKGK